MANLVAEVAKFYGTKKVSRVFIGAVKACNKKNATKVAVADLKFDEGLVAYFKHFDVYFAHDPHKLCKTGDLVLIRELPEKMTTLITHEVLKVVYPLGDITCPLTGKKVVNTKWNLPCYRNDLEVVYKVYGDNPNRFRYEEAPPRGWQEGKRDFTDKEVLPRFYEDQERTPYNYPV